jgi:hypothetical protein
MARIAVRVLQIVVAIDVALLALRRYMPTCQRKICCRVIERRWAPRGLRMTLQAIMTELSLLMIRICRVIKRRRMTIPACVR